jgi:prepilin peptidase dependent protein B
MLINERHRQTRSWSQQGSSLVELLVGITLGVFLAGGALSMLTSNLKGSQQLLLTARINQDLRAMADLVSRDLKRAGYWGNAISGMNLSTGSSAVTSNPYNSVTTAANTIIYAYSKDTTDNNIVDSNEQFGFKLSGGAVQMQTSSGIWQSVNDTSIITITAFSITETRTAVDASGFCTSAITTNTPTLYIRAYDVSLTGQAVSDSSITRTLATKVRLRNDQLTGACP